MSVISCCLLYSQALSSIRDLTQRISDGSFVIQGGVLDCDAHHICLLALLMEVGVALLIK